MERRRGRSRTCNTRKVPTASPRGTNEIKENDRRNERAGEHTVPRRPRREENDSTFLPISAYLGQKLNFDEARVDSDQYARNAQIAMEVFDLRNTVRQLVYKFPNSVRSAEEFEKQLRTFKRRKKTYAKLENWLQFHDFTYFAKKDGVSSCDFHAFEMIDQHEHYQTLVSGYDGKSSLLSEYPRLKKFHEADEE